MALNAQHAYALYAQQEVRAFAVHYRLPEVMLRTSHC
jgi:hypothetical protein